jgi:hypothetical protein
MRYTSILPILLLAVPGFAQLSVVVQRATQTQAVLQINGYLGACTIAVSQSPTFTPLHPDVNGTEYAGANTDTGRADTITQSDGTRLVTIGHMNDDRALAASTTYYLQVSGCGSTITKSFSTPTLGNGSSQQWPVPFNSSNPWNYGYPLVSLLSHGWVTDPVTGIQLEPLNIATDRTWRTGASPNHTPFAGLYTAFQNYAGGIGWSNPGNAISGAASNATTSNTNPLDLYGVYTRFGTGDSPWNGFSYDDFAVIPWASCSSSGTACSFTVCIFTSPSAGCVGSPITITAPSTFAQINSTSTSDPDFPFPASFPSAFFSGWGLTAPLGPDHVSTSGTLSCASSVCTISTLTATSHFPSTMAVGQKIYIAGTSPTCNGNMCTLASYQNAGQITVNENITVSGANYIAYMFGLRIQKVNNTGSITVGAAFKWAGSLGIGQGNATGFTFNPHSFTSGDGHVGYLAMTPTETNGGNAFAMYFVSSDGTVRSLWNSTIWANLSCYASTNSQDIPNYPGGYTLFSSGQPFPDANDPKTWYVYGGAGTSGSTTLYKIVYSGDTTEILSTGYAYDQSGNGFTINPPCGDWAVTNLMPASMSKDLVSQVAANPTWSGLFTTLYGNSGSSWAFSGITGEYALFQNNYAGQNNPAWIAQVNLSTGLLTNLIHTFDGTGTTGYYNGIRWSGLHTIDTYGAAALLVTEQLGNPSLGSAGLLSGPFQAQILGVLEADGVTWNTNTSLPWPVNTSSYDAACPAGNTYVFMGATGNNCVTFKFPVGGVCNANAQSLEKLHFAPCPWNASYTQPLALAVGDNFTDISMNGGIGDTGDSEHFRILSIATNSDNTLTVVAQRNAIYDGCSFNPTFFPGSTINNGTQAANELQHANGWTAVMSEVRLNGCNAGNYFLNPATGVIVENGKLLQGHGNLEPALSGNVSWLTSGVSKFNLPYNNLFTLPTSYYSLVGPTFQGQNLNVGGGSVQSYVGAIAGASWMVDANAMNPNSGTGPEQNGNNVGSVVLTTASLTGCNGNCYTISTLGATLNNLNYKLFPLIGWAGRYLLHDVSGPSSNIATSPWGICYVYHSGECGTGSTQGVVYVNVPGAYNSGNCNSGQSFLVAPCVVIGFPGGGGVRQQRISSADPTGKGSRLLSYLLTSPGELYPYSNIAASPDGSFALASAHHTQGWTTMAWVLKLPPWQEDSIDRTQLISVPVQIPPGAQYAEVQFGYSRFIGPNGSPLSFYCTPRAEACNTSGSPYNFESDTRTLTTCTNGCTINIPVMAPNVVYYRVRRSSDGVNWSALDVQAITQH